MSKLLALTDQEYENYLALTHLNNDAVIQQSLDSLKSLKDDIDKPIRKLVFGLALLGCEPMWSCCGFNYPGQHIHKRHQLGQLGIYCRRNTAAVAYLPALPYMGDEVWAPQYHMTQETRDGISVISLLFSWGPLLSSKLPASTPWYPEALHLYSELTQIRISKMEHGLALLEKYMQPEAILEDTNRFYRQRFRHWQYPELGDCAITRQDYEAA